MLKNLTGRYLNLPHRKNTEN